MSGQRATQQDLFGFTDKKGGYPTSPGFKEAGGTSQVAAEEIETTANILRQRVLSALSQQDLTADETATRLGVDRLSIRPRFSELNAQGLVHKTGRTRPNKSGKQAAVWALGPKVVG